MPSLDWYDCPIVIPYYGGKYELSKILVPLIPHHARYVEVFAGGLSMFFRKPKVKWNVLNDIDNNIINLYMCVIKDIDKLVYYLNWIPKSRKLFLDFKGEIKEQKEFEGTSAKPGTLMFEYTQQARPRYATTGMVVYPEPGDMYIFPALLQHWVAPFKSKVTRISVSGNLRIVNWDKLPKNYF